MRNSTQYSSVEAMMRIYVGINDHLTDINVNTTFYASDIRIVLLFELHLKIFIFFKLINFIVKHEHFNPDPSSLFNDIAIIRLNKPVILSENVSYICLRNNVDISPGQTVYAVGK